MLESYIRDGKINISSEAWTELNQHYTQKEITESLKHHILNGDISLPLKDISWEDAEKSFVELQNYRCSEYMGYLVTRYPYDFDDMRNGLYLSESNVGNMASDYFQQENRYKCGSVNSPSPVRTWSNEKFLDGLLRALWTLKCESVDSKTLRTCLSLRKYVASQFKPSIAKSIYEKFHSENVLDFSAGWGDRLCGFYACKNTQSYIGIDPNRAVYEKYFEQVKLYETFSHKETEFICAPAEEVKLPKECVDTVFTSPPYFNIERYCDDDTQSFKRYRKVEEWLEKFLFKAIDLSYSALKPNGYLLINISDVYSGHKVNHICDPMNYYIKKKRMKYQGVIGMQMAKRPNSKAQQDGVFIEPIWVWQK